MSETVKAKDPSQPKAAKSVKAKWCLTKCGLGNSIEANNNRPRVYESYRVSVQTDNGGFRAFDVPSPGDLRIGDRVRIDNGQISRY